MYLRKAFNKKTGRTYLSIVHGYRDKETKTTRAKDINSLDYLDEFEFGSSRMFSYTAKLLFI